MGKEAGRKTEWARVGDLNINVGRDRVAQGRQITSLSHPGLCVQVIWSDVKRIEISRK